MGLYLFPCKTISKMMTINQAINGSGISRAVYNFGLTISNLNDDFYVGLSSSPTYQTGFIEGFAFYGINGYLFANNSQGSDIFFGGYQTDIPFSVQFHYESGKPYKYYYNNVLMSNNYLPYTSNDPVIYSIESKKPEGSIINATYIYE